MFASSCVMHAVMHQTGTVSHFFQKYSENGLLEMILNNWFPDKQLHTVVGLMNFLKLF